jgi:tRNA-dihydrouridine synthase
MTAWLTALLEEDLAALTVHLRTRNEMSDVPARWELAPQIAALRNKIAPQTLILGNGDVASLEEARTRTREGGIDGVMIGRGMFGNPWFFNREREHNPPTLRERLERLVKHAELFEELYKTNLPRRTTGKNDPRPLKGFEIMKKHFKSYSSGFDDAKELRIKLMETENAAQVRAVTEEFLKTII